MLARVQLRKIVAGDTPERELFGFCSGTFHALFVRFLFGKKNEQKNNQAPKFLPSAGKNAKIGKYKGNVKNLKNPPKIPKIRPPDRPPPRLATSQHPKYLKIQPTPRAARLHLEVVSLCVAGSVKHRTPTIPLT